jgi:molybdopterin-containing oxidoreductase family iron-sulfur binding subunit
VAIKPINKRMKNKKGNSKNARRKFLMQTALGIGSLSLSGLLSSCSGDPPAGNIDKNGDTVKLLSPDGKLVEVDSSHVHTCGHATRKEARKGIPDRKFVMVIDLAKCNNERKCVTACQKAHDLSPDQEWMKVYLLQNSEETAHYWFPKPCFHCDNPICVSVCPVGATFKRSDGIVLVDNEQCIGCKFCMTGCPYSSRVFNWESPITYTQDEEYSPETGKPGKIGTVGKCDFCPDMAKEGELPHCVTACPMGTIYYGDINEDTVSNGVEVVRFSKLIAERDGYRFAEELGTQPSVYYLSAKDRTYPVEKGLDNLSDEMKEYYKKKLSGSV